MAQVHKRKLVSDLKTAVDAVVQENDAYGATDERTSQVVEAVRLILEDGLEGNRSIRPFIWSVVRRVGRAYPVTFHSSIDKVRALSRQDALDREQVEDAWIKQALHEGVLSSFMTNVVRQFQIRSAYLTEAIICEKSSRIAIMDLLDRLKGVIEPVPEAPSVSSWSSDDSFICTPRSADTEPVFEPLASHALSAKSRITVPSDDVGLSDIATEDEFGKDIGSGSVKEETSKQVMKEPFFSQPNFQTHPDKESTGHLGRMQDTPFSQVTEIVTDVPECEDDQEAKRKASEDSLGVKTPDRISLFGRISRTLSGSLYHTVVSVPTRKDSVKSELSPEEQTSRFWSRARSGSGSTPCLLREVEKDLGGGALTPVTSEEREKASRLLIGEMNRVSRLILQQYCSNRIPLNVDLYPLSKMLHLYEEAFAIGLRPSPLFQPIVPNMYLSDFEKIIPKGNATPYSVLAGIQAIYPHEHLGVVLISDAAESDDSSRFQQWLKNCLMQSHLGEKIETVLKHHAFLEGWYCPQAIVTNEDLVQELIATCRGLDAIAIEGASQKEDSALASGNTASDEKAKDKKSEDLSSVAPLSPDAIDTRVDYGHEAEANDSDEDWLISQVEGMRVTSRGITVDDDAGLSDSHDAHQDTASPRDEVQSSGKCTDDLLPPMAEHGDPYWSHSDDLGDVQHSLGMPVYQPNTLSKSGKLRLGEASRLSARHHLREASIVSSCISGEDEEDWRGVWKDVDIVRHEMHVAPNGEHYMAYIIEIMASDGTHWQTARRFSDLVSLNKNLMKQEVDLPHSWTNLAKARTVSGKKRFSDEITEARSALIRQCLWDLMTGFPESLVWTDVAEFLDAPLSLLRGTKSRQRSGLYPDEKVRNLIYDRISNHLNTMELIVDLPVQVSDEVLFEIQKGLCAGCQTYLSRVSQQKSLFRNSPSPRKCSYTELLYCHKCHQMDMAYLPSRVLHCWDFTKYPVSVSAKTYLYSVFPSPVLCIDAVNPGLLASVPILAHLEFIRQKIVSHMSRLRSRGIEGRRIALSIEENAGVNKHLLQNAEYWSLKDLGDISRGVFARLPRWLEAVNKQIEAVVEMHAN